MPIHPRKSIRTALVALLAGAGSLAGSRVYSTRFYAVETAPFLAVFTLEDSFEAYSSLEPRVLERRVRVAIEAVVASSTAPEDQLDTLAREVEQAIETDFLLGAPPLLLLNQYEGTVVEVPDVEPTKKVLVARLTYLMTYLDDLS